MDTRIFVVSNIKLAINASVEEAFSIAGQRLKKCGLDIKNAVFSIFRRSVDARKRENILFVYSISASGISGRTDKNRLAEHGINIYEEATLQNPCCGEEKLSAPPLIVGSGPCGLFAALLLSENGYKPTLIERGSSVSERKKAVDCFVKTGKLDVNTNIQFGAGGAGTFSDGKLITRINDPFSAYVLKKLVENGAPKEILYNAKPHIGTDILLKVVESITEKIKSCGGTILYNTKYLGSFLLSGESVARTDKFDIPYGALVLAVGHSARDTYKTLLSADYSIEPKPFSVGMRIEHLAADIDKALYGDFAGNEILGHAEYNLSTDTKTRGVYTFCMCPGGEVVAAASEQGGVVVNGMSNSARNGTNSNSAVVCSIFKEDYGNSAISAINFQKKIEEAAYRCAGGDYSAPIVTVGDFLSDKATKEPTIVKPTYMNSTRTRIVSPSEYMPPFVVSSIKNALLNFDKKINGFAANHAVLTGAETRTSAPIRILRDFNTRAAIGKDNVYPAGEGAGYAGGITSAAIDGARTAIAIMQRYKRS